MEKQKEKKKRKEYLTKVHIIVYAENKRKGKKWSSDMY